MAEAPELKFTVETVPSNLSGAIVVSVEGTVRIPGYSWSRVKVDLVSPPNFIMRRLFNASFAERLDRTVQGMKEAIQDEYDLEVEVRKYAGKYNA